MDTSVPQKTKKRSVATIPSNYMSKAGAKQRDWDSSSIVLCVISAGFVGVSAVAAYWLQERRYHRQKQRYDEDNQKWQNLRQEERTGRIRAEVKLRTALKELEQIKQQNNLPNRNKSSDQYDKTSDDKKTTTTMLLHSIGTVESPYKKRMGTPRQHQLVPSSRGLIHFTCPGPALDGIADYSHVWIIFEFHANTNIEKHNNSKKTKIRPPRAAGIKVGQLATRSPHRPNCLGLSLVKVDRWDAKTRQLHISGLDLVHGTPVYDVKPCVPWDIPNFYQNQQLAEIFLQQTDAFRVPAWVQQNDELSSVHFAPNALEELKSVVEQGCLAPLYTTQNGGVDAAQRSLQEILAQDPRSTHKGLKSNARGTTTNLADDAYSFLFGNTKVSFIVGSTEAEIATAGASDSELNKHGVKVLQISRLDTDSLVHADGIPLVSEGLG